MERYFIFKAACSYCDDERIQSLVRANQEKSEGNDENHFPTLLSVCTNMSCKHTDDITASRAHVSFTPEACKRKISEADIEPVIRPLLAASRLHTGGHRGSTHRGEGGRVRLGPSQQKRQSGATMTLTPPPYDAAGSGSGPVTVPPGANAQGFLGGVSVCCGMRSIKAGEGCFLCGPGAALLPRLSRSDGVSDVMLN